MTGRRVRIGASVVVVLACVVAIVAATRPSVEATASKSPLLGHLAPPITSPTLAGQPFSLSAERGHWVVLNFFASWCTPCQLEVPELVAFTWSQQHRVDGAVMASVVYDDSNSAASNFATTIGMTWPAITDPGGAIANAYGVTAPPTTFLINPAGRVEASFLGPVTAHQLDQALLRGAASR